MTDEYGDWRFETVNREFVGKKIEIACTEPIMHALFFLNDAVPFNNPQASLEHVARLYWAMLERASHIFSGAEWRALGDLSSPFHRGELSRRSAAEAVKEVEALYPGEDWRAELLAAKRLLPKIGTLSDVEFEAVNVILFLVGNLSSDDPWFTLSRKLPALGLDAAVHN